MKKYIAPVIILIIIAILAIVGYFYLMPKESNDSELNNDYPEEIEDKSDLIVVETPIAGQVIESPVLIKGKARGYWYFEASFPLVILDGSGNVVVQSYATAQGDWMTEDFVEFEAEVYFENPTTENGLLILEKDNPSGLPEHADEIIIPIRFEISQTQAIEKIAKDWIKNNSPTYKFDGTNLELVEVRGLDLVGCESCYEVEFYFESRQAGYGDRGGEMLAQVITPHTIVVLVDDGEVNSVVADDKYDEMKESFIEI